MTAPSPQIQHAGWGVAKPNGCIKRFGSSEKAARENARKYGGVLGVWTFTEPGVIATITMPITVTIEGAPAP